MAIDLSMQVDHSRRATRAMKIIDRYAIGDSISEIAHDFECSKSTILRFARAAGLPKRPKHFPEETRRRVISDLKAGRQYKTIVKKRKVSEAYISKVAKEEGLSRYGH